MMRSSIGVVFDETIAPENEVLTQLLGDTLEPIHTNCWYIEDMSTGRRIYKANINEAYDSEHVIWSLKNGRMVKKYDRNILPF